METPPEVLLGRLKCFREQRLLSAVCWTCLCISVDADWPQAESHGFVTFSLFAAGLEGPVRGQLRGRVVVKAALMAYRKMTSWDVAREIWVRRNALWCCVYNRVKCTAASDILKLILCLKCAFQWAGRKGIWGDFASKMWCISSWNWVFWGKWRNLWDVVEQTDPSKVFWLEFFT